MEYMTALEAAKLWGVSKRRIQTLCERGQLTNVTRLGAMWAIPKDTPKPPDGRTRKERQKRQDTETKR